ncbi:hypothetical protein A2U01_0020513, partial [Trifolium medium]|nr:hypothetical protein [Trifolium medium]
MEPRSEEECAHVNMFNEICRETENN